MSTQSEKTELIEAARRVRNMGSTLAVEDRTNPVCEWRCCSASVFHRWFVGKNSWPYCPNCRSLMGYRGPAKEQP